MLAKLIQSLFPEGQRKVMVSLIAILIGVILDKVAGGLSENMMNVLIAGVGLFTAGNVVEHIKGTLKGTKVGKVIEDIIPGDQGLGGVAAQPALAAQVQAAHANQGQVDMAAHVANQVVGGAMEEVGKRFEDMEKRMSEVTKSVSIQAGNIKKIVDAINGSRAQAQQAAQAQRPAPRPPAGDDDE